MHSRSKSYDLTKLQGGGSTFGVITSVTIKAFPSSTFLTATVFVGTLPGNPNYLEPVASVLAQYPALGDQGMTGYTFVINNFSSSALGITTAVSGVAGIFMLPALHPENTSESLTTTLQKIADDAVAPFPGQFQTSVTPQSYPDFWGWYESNNGPLDAGFDQELGSRLLDAKALTNGPALKEMFNTVVSDGDILSMFLVSGKGVHNAQPRGGGNAVNPAWRSSYVHTGRFRSTYGRQCSLV